MANPATFDNVNFQILLKQHGGNRERALKAWEAICHLGGFGYVPPSYEGGLDVKGLRIARDEWDHGARQGEDIPVATNKAWWNGVAVDVPIPEPALLDNLKRLEDLAAGDRPR